MQVFQNIHILGMIVQSSGAALISLLLALLYRSHPDSALRLWAWGWLALALALAALLADLLWPDHHLLLQPLYLFGEYLFIYFLVLGCANHVSGRRAVQGDARLLLPALVLAILVPVLARGEFARLFLVQSFILSLGFAIALWTLWPSLSARRSRSGMMVMAVALGVLAITFAHYLPIYGAHIATGASLPIGWLTATSVGHLLFEFLLGFGSCMVVLERLNDELRQRNRDLAMASEQFREQAERDPLTGVFNRRAFETLRQQLTGAGCVAMIDLDRMKQINDRFGHVEGDRALCTVTHRLRGMVRNQDRLFRWGGDELLLVMPGMPQGLLQERLEKLNDELRLLEFPDRSGKCMLSVSFGSAAYRQGGADLSATVRAADEAMYERKGSGRHWRSTLSVVPST